MIAKKYNLDSNSYIKVEIIGKVKYIGKSFGVEGLTNGKIYNVTGVENGMLKVIDDSEEEYLYSIIKPSCLTDVSLCGKWEIVEDNKDKYLKKIFQDLDNREEEK